MSWVRHPFLLRQLQSQDSMFAFSTSDSIQLVALSTLYSLALTTLNCIPLLTSHPLRTIFFFLTVNFREDKCHWRFYPCSEKGDDYAKFPNRESRFCSTQAVLQGSSDGERCSGFSQKNVLEKVCALNNQRQQLVTSCWMLGKLQ